MDKIGIYIMPSAVALILLFGLIRKVPVFEVFLTGAKEGLTSSLGILPTLIALVAGISMLRASGALELLSSWATPVVKWLGIPAETVPLALLRPVSGSGSLAILEDIFKNYGTDSLIGRVASVMMGSTETTFYAVAVYYGSVGIKKTRHTIPAAGLADLSTCILSALTVRLLFP